MKYDFFAALSDEIRDEALERFITERRILELQIEDLGEQARRVRGLGVEVGRHVGCLAYWLVNSEMRESLLRLLGISDLSPWKQYVEGAADYGSRFILVGGWRARTKLRRILIELYRRVCQGMARYRAAYEHLSTECEAVNFNISKFQDNSELFAVLSFVKALDTSTAEKSRFLGGNFTPQELSSVENSLCFHPVELCGLGVFPPLRLAEPEHVERDLRNLADEVYSRCPNEIRHLIAVMKARGTNRRP